MRVAWPPHLAVALVIASAAYTAALCFANTNVTGISNSLVAVIDGAIVLAALALSLHRASRWLWIVLGALAANFLLLALASGDIELKAVRDPLVLVAFAALGWRYGGVDRARLAFFGVSVLVLAFAAFEYLAPGAYTRWFNVIDFYAARGVVDPHAIQNLDSAFFVSGARPDERMLLPALGSHRVSSIFLEPVSMGNFGALGLIFALSLDRAHWGTALAAGVVSLAAIALADARFASMVAILFVIARLAPLRWSKMALPFLPPAALAIVLIAAFSDVGRGDDLLTRLASSGRILLDMSPGAYFGLSSYEITTFDSGYAYAFSALGLPLCIVLWAAFVSLTVRTQEGARYKVLLGVYIAALLCISGSSLFALKTAGLGFFVLGALAAPAAALAPARRPATAPAARAAPA